MNTSNDKFHNDNIPHDWWNKQSVCKTLRDCFQRHVIGLHVEFSQRDKVMHDIFTGFLLHYAEDYFWITSGHIIDTIKNMILDSSVTIKHTHWMDHSLSRCLIPCDLPAFKSYRYDVDGLDLGIISLRSYYVNILTANKNIEFLNDKIWFNHANAQPEGFYVLGYPREWLEVNVNKASGKNYCQLYTGLACLPLKLIDDRGKESNVGLSSDFWGHDECIYGELIPFSDTNEKIVNSIKGMSGGPILSIELTSDKRMKYRLYGIQSCWNCNTGEIRASCIKDVSDVLVELKNIIELGREST